jgi:hypothetical protein
MFLANIIITILIQLLVIIIIEAKKSHNGLAMCKFNNEHMGFNYNFEL